MIPGLCGQLQTNLFAVLPNTIPGATLYNQIFCLDAGQKGFWKLAVSDGMKLSIPTSGTRGVKVTRLFNSINGVTETRSSYFAASSVSYGLPIQLTY